MKSVTRQNFEFQRLADGSISCVYRPKNRFVKKTTFLCVAQPETMMYEFFKVCEASNPMWYNLNYLAHLMEKYDNEIIVAI